MLPFSTIACAKCRQFAVRSFASAVAASSPSTSSNPARIQLSSQLGEVHVGSRNTKRRVHRASTLSPTSAGHGRNSTAIGSARSSRQSSTLAQLLEEQRKRPSQSTTSGPAISLKAISEPISEPIEKLRFLPHGAYAQRRRLKRQRIFHGRNATATVLSKKHAPDADTIIIRPLGEDAAQKAALTISLRKAAKIAAPTAAPHGRKKAMKVKNETPGSARRNPKKQIINGTNPSLSGFEKQHKEDNLASTSESGFRINASTPKQSNGAAIAAMERLSARVTDPNDSLKRLFARYLEPNLDVQARLQVLEDIRSRLLAQSAEDGTSSPEDFETELELISGIERTSDADPIEGTLVATEVKIDTVTPLKDAEVATLAHGLQRVLFNPGIHWLQHPRTGFYNYTKAVQAVADKEDFDFGRLPKFVRPSQDADLRELLKQSARKFAGSTSSLTSAMSQIYFALNSKKKLNTQTPNFVDQPRKFSAGARMPASIVLRLTDEGTYLVDADKSMEKEGSPDQTILSELGHVLERQLTLEPSQFSRFMKSSPDPFEPHEMREKREAYHYYASKNLVMRSQLDCHNDRLPRKTFDIKTRATVAIRMDTLNYQMNRNYLIARAEGPLESFEREKYDLVRSAFLKYSMQVRIGNMDGIFLAYHSTGQIFGFEYLSLEDLDKAISGSHEESTQAFHLCVGLLETIFERVTADRPGTTLRLHMQGDHGTLRVFAEPRPDLSLSASEQGTGGEFKDKNDTAEFASEGIKSYTFKITNYLNGHEVAEGSPVDFASVPVEHIATGASSTSASEEASKEDRLSSDSTPSNSSKSAFQTFLDQSENRDVASAEAEESKFDHIKWSIKYSIIEDTEPARVRKALMKLRDNQMMFGKYVLLPEGLPRKLVSSIVGHSSALPRKDASQPNGQSETEEGSLKQISEKESEDTQKVEEAATSDGAKTDTPSAVSRAATFVEKWTAFRPRSGVRYTTTPTGLIATIRRIAARNRKRLSAAVKGTKRKSFPKLK